MNFKEKHINAWMKMAESNAVLSPDKQTQVGAVLIKNKSKALIATGYNGFLRGACDDRLPNTRPEKYPYMIHAEANLIYNCARHGINMEDCTLICTLSPCEPCLRACYQCGIRTIVFKEVYILDKDGPNERPITEDYPFMQDVDVEISTTDKGFTVLELSNIKDNSINHG